MKKVNVTNGTIWEERGSGKRFEVAGSNAETGAIQLVATDHALADNAGYRITSEKSLRSNYKLVEMAAAKTPEPIPVQTPPSPAPITHPESPVSKAFETLAAKAKEDKGTRAPTGRVQLKDGTIIAGSKFITETCGKLRDDTYKVDSPIRWLQKPAGQELLASQGAKIVVGEKLTK